MHSEALTALALLLAAAVAMGLFMARLRMPAAAGFILIGVLLGPSGWSIIDTTPMIATLADLGVLMLLFLIGMELRLQSFRKLLPLALGVTIATILIIASTVWMFTLAVHGELKGGIVIGFMLSISSPAVAMKMMNDVKEKNTNAGRLAVAILVAQDLAVVPLLLITNGLGADAGTGGGLFGIAWRLALALGLLVGFIALLGKVKSFRFPGDEYLLRDFDVGTLGIVGLCFAAAALSSVIGLSPALGAFLGGLFLGHSTLRRAAESMAQPIQSILLFIFFLSVGLLIDLQYLEDQMWVILAALVVVTGGKTFLNWLLLMIAGEPFDTAVQSSLFLSPVGEFSFVIAGAGLSVGALSPDGYKLAIAVIAMSLLASPIWFLMARLMHKLIIGQAQVLGFDLAELRLWGRPQPVAVAATPEWDPGQSGL
jgi:CPA2 family monovalent cation:H+ antiporter-2